MATLEDLVGYGYIQELVQRGVSHSHIAQHLQQIFPGIRGLSSRSVRRFWESL